jgi:hypothetical protein
MPVIPWQRRGYCRFGGFERPVSNNEGQRILQHDYLSQFGTIHTSSVTLYIALPEIDNSVGYTNVAFPCPLNITSDAISSSSLLEVRRNNAENAFKHVLLCLPFSFVSSHVTSALY